MARIRIHFSKKGYACFISHIDLPMLFGRAARRAGLLPEQTQGFSPHPHLALGPPLPVGVTALCEPADFWFVAWDDAALGRWNDHLPVGVEILRGEIVDGVSLHKLCTAAAYRIEPQPGGADAGEIASALEGTLREAGALLRAYAADGVAYVCARDLERCGPSRMVKDLIALGVVAGWSDLDIARTAVGSWHAETEKVIPLTEEPTA